MKIFFNKKGSFSVFVAMLMVSLVFAVWSVVNAAGVLAIESTANSFGTLWAKSILAEYDLALRDKYGLLAFYGDKHSVENKLENYIDYSFKDKEYIAYEKPKCDLDKYSMTEVNNVKKQIELITAEGLKPKSEKSQDSGSIRSINSLWIIENLPSYKKTEDLYIVGLANKIRDDMNFKTLIGSFAVDRYIFSFFKDYMADRDLGKTFFNCEVEYIITGKYSDKQLADSAGDKIVLLRNILNLYYLYTCQEKRDGALALANTITPGAMAFITQGIILETWAYAEAKNDLKLLYDNKAVALLKDDYNWALSLENVFNIQEDGQLSTEESKDTYLQPEKIEGLVYSDYLKVLLYGVPEKTKILRILDLIQINMKYAYRDYFLVRDYYCGLSYSLTINGNLHEFKDQYV